MIKTTAQYLAVAAMLAIPAATWAATADLQDGSAAEGNYTAAPVKGSTSQPLGRIQFVVASGTPTITQIQVALSGATRTGLTHLKMWGTGSSSTFTSPLQFGSTVAADPGVSTITFNDSRGLASSAYFWLTGDLDSTASGTVSPHIVGVSMGIGDNLTGFSGGADPMANNWPFALPVSVSAFSAE